MEHSLVYIARSDRTCPALTYAFSGISQTMPSHSFGPAMRSALVVHIVLAGTGQLQANGTTYTISAGEGFVIRPDTPSVYRSSSNEPWTYFWMGIAGADIESHLDDMGIGASDVFTLTDPLPLLGIVAESLRHTASTPADELKLNALAYEFLYELGRQATPNAALGTRTPTSSVAASAIRFIVQHYAKNIGASDVADGIHVDRSYLSRVFHDETGSTLKAYIDRIRVAKACDLLSMTNLDIAAIAQACGFSSPEVFARKFRSDQQLTPTDYRQLRESSVNDLPVDLSVIQAILRTSR